MKSIAKQRQERAQDIARHPMKNARQALANQRPDGLLGEWEAKDSDKWDIHEKLAAKSFGVLTAANAISLTGALLTKLGVEDYKRGRYWPAVGKMFIGRCLDLVDGPVSRKFGTRSVVGAGVDAFLDKALAADFIITAVEQGDISAETASLHLEQQLGIAYTNLKIKRRGGEPNPGIEGKHGQGALWFYAGGVVLKKAWADSGLVQGAAITDDLAEGSSLLAVYLNEQAISTYTHQFEDL